MLEITIPKTELYDSKNNRFVNIEEQTLRLEHSLVSLSKWESKWHKPFLSDRYETTYEETLDYIKCMTITQNVKPEVYNAITAQHVEQIKNYINSQMTATYFSHEPKGTINGEEITSELIYYWMSELNIPWESQKWHLSRLIALIKIFNVKRQPEQKRSESDMWADYEALNKARREKLNSKG